MPNLYLPAGALVFSTLLLFIYFSKERVKLLENKIYAIMLIANFLDSLINVIIYFNIYTKFNKFFVVLGNRIDFAFLIIWITGLFLYTFIISYENNKKVMDKFKYVVIASIILNVILYGLILSLPMEIALKNLIEQTAIGASVDFTYLAWSIYMFLSLILTLINRKKLSRKYIPIMISLVFSIAMYVVYTINPYANIAISFLLTFVNFLMYFTIENPDMKTIYELNKNKQLIENINEEKYNFLFNLSQEIREPISNIIDINEKMEKTKDLKEIAQALFAIENNAKGLKMHIDNVLDISNMNTSSLIVSNDTYNIYNLFDSVLKNVSPKINDKIELRHYMSKELPDELYGDSIKLKQIITTILMNAVDHTKEGFIAVDVNEITKYDICRLIIKIEDSGCGMSIEKVNEFLNKNSELSKQDLGKITDLNLNLNLAFKIIKTMGGFINIKSEEGKGSTFTIVLDQKISNSKSKNEYEKYKFNKKRILIVSNQKDTLDRINGFLENYNINCLKTMYGKDCIDKINNKEVFDLIIMEDEMEPDSAINTLEELKKIDGFKIPVVVMLSEDKEAIKEHYIKDGFSDYILKKSFKEEIDRIIKKYI